MWRCWIVGLSDCCVVVVVVMCIGGVEGKSEGRTI
jgi:hypothetical protein